MKKQGREEKMRNNYFLCTKRMVPKKKLHQKNTPNLRHCMADMNKMRRRNNKKKKKKIEIRKKSEVSRARHKSYRFLFVFCNGRSGNGLHTKKIFAIINSLAVTDLLYSIAIKILCEQFFFVRCVVKEIMQAFNHHSRNK